MTGIEVGPIDAAEPPARDPVIGSERSEAFMTGIEVGPIDAAEPPREGIEVGPIDAAEPPREGSRHRL